MFSSVQVLSTRPRVKLVSNIQTPTSQMQIVGAKLLSNQNVLYILLLVYHKYFSVKSLVVGRRILGRNVVRVVAYRLCHVNSQS